MFENIVDKGVNRSVRAEDRFEIPEGTFALLDDRLVRLHREGVVFVVEKLQRLFVESKLDDAAFVVDRKSRPVFHGAGHVVDVDIVPENFARASVAFRDRRARKANIGRVRQAIAHTPRGADDAFRILPPVLVRRRLVPLGESVLTAVRFVRHDDDIAPFRKRFVGIREFLHRREEDSVPPTSFEQFAQMRSALRLHWFLTQEIAAFGELSVELIVQIVPVGENDDRRGVDRLLKKMRVEDHREGFSAPLRVPEDAPFSVRFHRLDRFADRAANRVILVISRENLRLVHPVARKTEKILENIEKTRLVEESLKEDVELRNPVAFALSVFRFPLHEAIFGRGDRPRFGDRHIAHNADRVVDEEFREILHIVPKLKVRFRRVGFVARRGFKLDRDEREPVDEEDEVESAIALIFEDELPGDDEGVILRVLEVDEINEIGALLAIEKIGHGHAVL